MNGILTRHTTGPEGTFGTLSIDGAKFATGELPDKHNAQGVSCIPAGTYQCSMSMSQHLGHAAYHVLDVPGRSGILIHAGNFAGSTADGLKSDVLGCIALGMTVGEINGQKAMIASRPAITRFEDLLGGEDFTLTILDEYNEAGEIGPSV